MGGEENGSGEHLVASDSDVVSTQETDDVAFDLEKDLDLELEAKFALADFDDLLEPYMQLKSLRKKTVQFAEQIPEEKSADDGTSSESDHYTDALDDGENDESTQKIR